MHSFCSNVPFKRLFRLFTIDQVTILYHIDSNPNAWSNTINCVYNKKIQNGFLSLLNSLLKTIFCHLRKSMCIKTIVNR